MVAANTRRIWRAEMVEMEQRFDRERLLCRCGAMLRARETIASPDKPA